MRGSIALLSILVLCATVVEVVQSTHSEIEDELALVRFMLGALERIVGT